MPVQKSRFWCFTLHPNGNQVIPMNLPNKARYCVYQKECGEGGKEHFQGYIEFNEPVGGGQRVDWVKQFIPGAHTEVKYSQREDARHYCMKPCSKNCEKQCCVDAREKNNGRIDWENTKCVELGSMETNPGQRNDIVEFRNAVRNGYSLEQLKDINYGYVMSHYRAVLSEIALYQKPRDWKTVVEIIYGDSGCGKSRYCKENYPDAYWLSKSCSGNVWWNGYNGQDVVIIDDFYGWIPFDYMLRLMDRYSMSGETKGGVVNLIPKRLVITSNKAPCKWYSKVYEEDSQLEIAFARRIDSIEYWSNFLGCSQLVKRKESWRDCGGFVDTPISSGRSSVVSAP